MSDILTHLARKYHSDKFGQHNYTPHFERHFSAYRDHPIKLLEIGVDGSPDPTLDAGSLRMWRDYFSQGRIVGLNLDGISSFSDDRVTVVRGRQSDEAALRSLSESHGPFDIIIDDGTHDSQDVISTFEVLFPLLRSDGVYVVEDLQTSYWEIKGGSTIDRNSPKTSMGYLKSLVDGLNHAEFDLPGYDPSYFDRHVISISFYHNIAFVYKGSNDEGSNILTDNVLPTAYRVVR